MSRHTLSTPDGAAPGRCSGDRGTRGQGSVTSTNEVPSCWPTIAYSLPVSGSVQPQMSFSSEPVLRKSSLGRKLGEVEALAGEDPRRLAVHARLVRQRLLAARRRPRSAGSPRARRPGRRTRSRREPGPRSDTSPSAFGNDHAFGGSPAWSTGPTAAPARAPRPAARRRRCRSCPSRPPPAGGRGIGQDRDLRLHRCSCPSVRGDVHREPELVAARNVLGEGGTAKPARSRPSPPGLERPRSTRPSSRSCGCRATPSPLSGSAAGRGHRHHHAADQGHGQQHRQAGESCRKPLAAQDCAPKDWAAASPLNTAADQTPRPGRHAPSEPRPKPRGGRERA